MKALLLWGALGAAIAGCGLDVQAPDLFLLTRTGVGRRLTLLVSDGGSVTCDGGKSKPLSSRQLIQARDLMPSLATDAGRRLRIARGSGSVAIYTVRVQQGTFSFPDTAARTRPALAQLELLATQLAQSPCGLGG